MEAPNLADLLFPLAASVVPPPGVAVNPKTALSQHTSKLTTVSRRRVGFAID
jgi:hypothetical protein